MRLILDCVSRCMHSQRALPVVFALAFVSLKSHTSHLLFNLRGIRVGGAIEIAMQFSFDRQTKRAHFQMMTAVKDRAHCLTIVEHENYPAADYLGLRLK